MTNQSHPDKPIMLVGPEMGYARLASLKGALKLESVGLKTRGGALRPRLAAELGLKPRDSYATFINKIIELMNEQLKAKGTPESLLIKPYVERESKQK